MKKNESRINYWYRFSGLTIRIGQFRGVGRCLLCLIIFFFSGCNKYVAYKTIIHTPEKSKNQVGSFLAKKKDFLLSVKGVNYPLENPAIQSQDSLLTARIAPSMGRRQIYFPDQQKSSKDKGKYDKKAGEGYVLNQVFLLADTMIRNGDSVSVPLSSIQRIDEIKKDTGPQFILVFSFLVLLVLVLSLSTLSFRSSNNGCFIATACYGDYDAPEVLVLRRYRDQVLLKSRPGRIFVRTYYFLSPPMARWLGQSESLRDAVRKYAIAPLVTRLRMRY